MFVNINEIDDNLFFSSMSESFDTRPADIYTFVPKQYPYLTKRLNKYSEQLKDNHRLLKNYTSINFFDYQIASLWARGSKVVGFATGWKRDFYKANSIRILNRFYHDKETFRIKFTRELLRPSTFHCVQQQILLAGRLGYSYAFISREPRTNKFFSNFIDSLSNRSTHKWEFKEGPFLVAPDSKNKECWQSIGVTKLKPTKEDFWI